MEKRVSCTFRINDIICGEVLHLKPSLIFLMKVLYIGPLFSGSTALHRMQALQALGCEIFPVNTELPLGFGLTINSWRGVLKRVMKRTDPYLDWQRVHAKVRSFVKQHAFDVVWVDKGMRLKSELLQWIKKQQPTTVLVNYSPDDMFNPANQTTRYLNGLPLYDLFVTTKSYNVKELETAGARAVCFVGNAFEPSIHKPVQLSQAESDKWGCQVCFVGACEAERQRSIEALAKAGVHVGLFGPWEHLAAKYANVRCHTGFFADEAYAKALCAGKIGLGFLRKVNRDLQTTRSIELPACGVFMLAERTNEHLELFEEGKEAEFFSSDEELLSKVHYYLENDDLRKEIAAAGRWRCLNSGYSNEGRLKTVLDRICVIRSSTI